MAQLELSEIQSLLFNDYKEMGSSKYYLLQVNDQAAAKKFLASIAENITPANSTINETCLNIGLTSQGLIALGYNHEENIHSFSREFREGIVTEHRQRLLGDFDSSDPSKWQWGGPNNEQVDVILMVFGKNEAIAENYFQGLKKRFEQGFSVVHVLDGKPLPKEREHFGFRDGISQPVIKGSNLTPAGNNDDINPGEFILGYKNEYGVYPDAPFVKIEQGNTEILPNNPGGYEDRSGNLFKDIGKNGTYFVLRQLKQDVNGYWSFIKKQTIDEKGKTNNEEATRIAAKMMGRWPSGAPLVKYPDKDPGIDSDDNSFGYLKEDKEGEKCPFGSHIRRTNPRDQFEESPPGVSLKLTRRHRIMRRVRSYGEDFIGSAEDHQPNGEVGLLFGCFNANISKQFEFIQYTWANSPKFKRLYDDPDPIIGVRECPANGVKQNFTIPQSTVNKVIPNLQSFVTVRGGAYFFFPSITALKFLATI
ncbi:MAG TPA: Dyp-type peroxidase [Chitinophagaceae bacterium]